MPIIDIFSKRQNKLRGNVPDVYVYDKFPTPLRVQIVQIWTDVLGGPNDFYRSQKPKEAYEFVTHSLRHEYGVFQLSEDIFALQGVVEELTQFFLNEQDIEKALDAVEVSFNVIDQFTRGYDYLRRSDASARADQAINELNNRFKEHGIGYQFVPPHIVCVNSELIHSEVVKPALRLLNQQNYKGVQEEFLKAHEHYRKGNSKEALTECLKAFESTMKVICDKRGWNYDKNATSRPLIQTCFDNELIPSFWQQHYASLRSLLESSIPTGRNRLGAHGQGTNRISVPDHLVAYMLHMTASAIVFLAEAEKSIP